MPDEHARSPLGEQRRELARNQHPISAPLW